MSTDLGRIKNNIEKEGQILQFGNGCINIYMYIYIVRISYPESLVSSCRKIGSPSFLATGKRAHKRNKTSSK